MRDNILWYYSIIMCIIIITDLLKVLKMKINNVPISFK